MRNGLDDQCGNLIRLHEDFTSIRKWKQSQKEAVSSLSKNTGAESKGQNGVGRLNQVSSSSVVGLTPAELESLNELIHIDHIYVKSQPESPISKTVSDDEDDSHIHESSEIPVGMEMYVSHEAATPTELSVSELPKQVSPHISNNGNNLVSKCDDSCVVSLGSEAVVKNEIPNLEDVLNSDDILESFSDSDVDMEASWSLNILEQLGLDQRTNDNILLDETRGSLASLQSTSIQSTNFKLPETPDVIAELDSSNFFSNIENYLYENTNDSSVKPSSPLSISNSDSDFYSDTAAETLSPLGSEGSLLEDLPWNDSFTDLFPEIL